MWIDLRREADFTGPMRLSMILVVLALGFAGCARRQAEAKFSGLEPRSTGSAPARAGQGSKLIVTPETVLAGSVIRVNGSARFVVLNFPVGHLPAVDQQMALYRQRVETGP